MTSPFELLSLIIAVPFVGMLFALSAKEDEAHPGRNVFNVSMFTIIVNLTVLWRIFMKLDLDKPGLQLVERFNWLANPQIDIIFGVDLFSLILILALHLAYLIGLVGLRHYQIPRKSLLVFALLFLSMFTGFLVAADIFSFYIFFEAMLLPLFMMIGMFGEVRKPGAIYRFFIYNLIGAVILFSAVMLLYQYQNGVVAIRALSSVRLGHHMEYYIWTSLFLALLSRLPIWPFHYWISSINAGLRNPLVFVIANMLPLTGVYGFIRFLPSSLPDFVEYYVMILEIVAVITILFIALISFINKDFQYKLFAFVTVYYLMYLLVILPGTSPVLHNVGFSFFSFVLIVAGLEVLTYHIHRQQERLDSSSEGLLCAVPRLSFVYSFFVLAAIGLPLSSLFLNNFVILSRLFGNNLQIGLLVVLAILLIASAFLQELFRLKTRNVNCSGDPDDISKANFAFMLLVIFILVMSMVRPLWFMGV